MLLHLFRNIFSWIDPLACGIPASVPYQTQMQGWVDKATKQQQKSSTNIPTSLRNLSKINEISGPRGSWGQLWDHFSTQGPPAQKKRQNTCFVGRPLGFPKEPQSHHFHLKTWRKGEKMSVEECILHKSSIWKGFY